MGEVGGNQLVTNLCFVIVMKEERLSENGVEKLIGDIPGVVVQVLGLQEKTKNNQRFFGCDLSDGYCRLRGCLIVDDQIFTHKKAMKEHLVIKVTSSSSQNNKQNQPIVIIEHYTPLVLNVSQVVGKPMFYEEFVKKGRKNAEGNNLIVKEEELPQVARQNQSKTLKRKEFIDDILTSEENDKEQRNLSKTSNTNPRALSKDNTNQTKLNLVPKVDQKPQLNASNSTTVLNKPKVEQKAKAGPIEKVEVKRERKSESMAKGQQRKPNSEYSDIKSLYIGMENWVVLARVIFVSPLKQIMTKKGTQSSVLTLQIGDKSGTIECNMFRESALRFQGTFKEQQLYEFSGGMINESSYMGKHEMKITFNELSKISLKEDDPSVPYSQDFCVSVKRLTEIAIGEEARVICLIKDEAEAEDFTSKAGKELRRKVIYLCDPEEKVEVEITLWNDKSEIRFEKFPYMLKGVIVTSYRDNRQYSLKSNFQYRVMKQHNLRRYIKDMDSIPFLNPNSNNKPKRSAISNFFDLNNAEDVGAAGIWSEVVCFLNGFRQTGKNFYMSCPNCKKKVTEEQNSTCGNCNQPYQAARYRYILSLNLTDHLDSIWATAYDEVGEKLLGLGGGALTAGEFAKMNDQEVQELMRGLRFKEVKLRMVTKNEEFNNEMRKKTNIIKIVELNYAEESRLVLGKLTHLLAQ